jgi:hypothetical protein
MTNQQINALAEAGMDALRSAKVLNDPSSTAKRTLYEALKDCDGKYDYSIGNNPANIVQEEELQEALEVLDDPVRARAWWLTRLKRAMDTSANAQIAKELRDVLQIASREERLRIEVVDYRSMCDDCPLGRLPLVGEVADAGTPPATSVGVGTVGCQSGSRASSADDATAQPAESATDGGQLGIDATDDPSTAPEAL